MDSAASQRRLSADSSLNRLEVGRLSCGWANFMSAHDNPTRTPYVLRLSTECVPRRSMVDTRQKKSPIMGRDLSRCRSGTTAPKILGAFGVALMVSACGGGGS